MHSVVLGSHEGLLKEHLFIPRLHCDYMHIGKLLRMLSLCVCVCACVCMYMCVCQTDLLSVGLQTVSVSMGEMRVILSYVSKAANQYTFSWD